MNFWYFGHLKGVICVILIAMSLKVIMHLLILCLFTLKSMHSKSQVCNTQAYIYPSIKQNT